MNVNVDLDEVYEVLHSEDYTSWLLNNTTDFGTAAFILQAGFDAYEKAKAQVAADEIDSK